MSHPVNVSFLYQLISVVIVSFILKGFTNQ